jgi:hypothetical protein
MVFHMLDILHLTSILIKVEVKCEVVPMSKYLATEYRECIDRVPCILHLSTR